MEIFFGDNKRYFSPTFLNRTFCGVINLCIHICIQIHRSQTIKMFGINHLLLNHQFLFLFKCICLNYNLVYPRRVLRRINEEFFSPAEIAPLKISFTAEPLRSNMVISMFWALLQTTGITVIAFAVGINLFKLKIFVLSQV